MSRQHHAVYVSCTPSSNLRAPARIPHLSSCFCVVRGEPCQCYLHFRKALHSSTTEVEGHVGDSGLGAVFERRPIGQPVGDTRDGAVHVLHKQRLYLGVCQALRSRLDLVVVGANAGDSLACSRFLQIESYSNSSEAEGVGVRAPKVPFVLLLRFV